MHQQPTECYRDVVEKFIQQTCCWGERRENGVKRRLIIKQRFFPSKQEIHCKKCTLFQFMECLTCFIFFELCIKHYNVKAFDWKTDQMTIIKTKLLSTSRSIGLVPCGMTWSKDTVFQSDIIMTSSWHPWSPEDTNNFLLKIQKLSRYMWTICWTISFRHKDITETS